MEYTIRYFRLLCYNLYLFFFYFWSKSPWTYLYMFVILFCEIFLFVFHCHRYKNDEQRRKKGNFVMHRTESYGVNGQCNKIYGNKRNKCTLYSVYIAGLCLFPCSVYGSSCTDWFYRTRRNTNSLCANQIIYILHGDDNKTIKAQAQTQDISSFLFSSFLFSVRNVILLYDSLSECEESIRNRETTWSTQLRIYPINIDFVKPKIIPFLRSDGHIIENPIRKIWCVCNYPF